MIVYFLSFFVQITFLIAADSSSSEGSCGWPSVPGTGVGIEQRPCVEENLDPTSFKYGEDLYREHALLTEEIIGDDSDFHFIQNDRRMLVGNVDQFPYTAIASLRIKMGGKYLLGTAFLTFHGYMITAAHNVYNFKEKLAAEEIIVFFGRHKDTCQEQTSVVYYAYPCEYADGKENERSLHDYALLFLPHPEFGNKLGQLGYFYTGSFSLEKVIISGYPGIVTPMV